MTEKNRLIINPPDLKGKKGVLNGFLRAIQDNIGFIPKSKLQNSSNTEIQAAPEKVTSNR
jgi:hypothetical protein